MAVDPGKTHFVGDDCQPRHADLPADQLDEAVWGAWRDPRAVMPHLAEQCRQWEVELRAIAAEVGVVQGALDDTEALRALADIDRRLEEILRQVANRASAYQTVADELGKEASTT